MSSSFSTGNFPANPLEKAGYRLDFHDEFDGSTLDTTKWLPYYLPHWSSRSRTAPHYVMADSCLTLQIVKDQAPWCPEFDGEVRCSSIQTGEYAGAVGSKAGQLQFNRACVVREVQENVQLYTPLYGYFELRAKGLTTGGNLAALWMIGYEDMPERSGEICNFELLGTLTGEHESRVRFGVHPWADDTLADEFYEEAFPINTAQFHLYGLEWTPTHIDFYIDNIKIKTIHQSPAYPMQFMLSLYEHPFVGAASGPYDPNAPYPKSFVIDYFRAYQPIDGYSLA